MKYQHVLLIATIAAGSGACIDDTEMTRDDDGTTGEPPPDGVYVNCLNEIT